MNKQPLSNTYCDRPFNELHIEEDGRVTPCCVMPSNRFPMGDNVKDYLIGIPLKTLRQDLLSGVKNENCEVCWKNEENNIRSHRINENRNKALHSIHIRLTDVCNFKCRMCGPAFSSAWAQENRKHGYFKFNYGDTVKDAIEVNSKYLYPLLEKYIKSGELKHIQLSGGEPLVTDANLNFLNFLLDKKLTDVTISYSTNLSNLNYKNIDLLSLWNKFNRVSLEVSVDGWGKAVEYSRTGFSLQRFQDNFTLAFNKNYIDAVNCVVNIYSVWTLPYIERFRRLGLNIVYSPCYLPPHLNPQILLKEDKLKLFELYTSYPELVKVYENFIDKNLDDGYTITEKGKKLEYLTLSDLRKNMISFNTLLDKYRGTSFFETFPMYRKYESLNG
jgi:organic radical activating enzyme